MGMAMGMQAVAAKRAVARYPKALIATTTAQPVSPAQPHGRPRPMAKTRIVMGLLMKTIKHL
jgi:hypothetical protein